MKLDRGGGGRECVCGGKIFWKLFSREFLNFCCTCCESLIVLSVTDVSWVLKEVAFLHFPPSPHLTDLQTLAVSPLSWSTTPWPMSGVLACPWICTMSFFCLATLSCHSQPPRDQRLPFREFSTIVDRGAHWVGGVLVNLSTVDWLRPLKASNRFCDLQSRLFGLIADKGEKWACVSACWCRM